MIRLQAGMTWQDIVVQAFECFTLVILCSGDDSIRFHRLDLICIPLLGRASHGAILGG